MLHRFLIAFLLLSIGTAVVGWLRDAPVTAIPARLEASTRDSLSHQQRTYLPPTRLGFLTDCSQPYQVRINLLRNTLTDECSEPEIRYLYELLVKDKEISEIPEHRYVIANDIMVQLLKHETNPERFAENFSALLNDSNQPAVLRDYAVQYLGTWLNPRSALATPSELATPSPEGADQVLDTIVAATTDPALSQTSIPGTALMMLVALTRSDSGINCHKAVSTLKPWLAQALGNTSSLSLSVRVSAVTAAGVLAPKDFLPTLRGIAFKPAGNAALQLPALASLGQAGEAEDLPRLQEVAATQPTLAYAAADACRVLSNRLSGNSPGISH